MAHLSTVAREDDLASVPIANWYDGAIIHSVVVPHDGRVDHEYWVVRDGQVVARFASLAAIDDWRTHGLQIGRPVAA